MADDYHRRLIRELLFEHAKHDDEKAFEGRLAELLYSYGIGDPDVVEISLSELLERAESTDVGGPLFVKTATSEEWHRFDGVPFSSPPLGVAVTIRTSDPKGGTDAR